MSLLLHLLAVVAFAGDDDFDPDDDIDIPAPTPVPAPAPSTAPAPAPAPDDGDETDTSLDNYHETGDGTDLLGDEDQPEGNDTEKEYRSTQQALSTLEPDEAIEGWNKYLAAHPNTPYKTEIDQTIEDLTNQMYDFGSGRGTGPVDASKAEFDFAQPIRLENINPRTRLQVGLEWGLPAYASLDLDYENAFTRRFSAHAGFRREYSGWNLETGARFALVKSLRTKMLLTGILDVRFNTDPFFPAFRPELALGKRFGKLDAAILGGADLALQTYDLGTGTGTATGAAASPDSATELEPNLTGGAMLYYAASDRVGGFAEMNLYLRDVPADGAFQGGLFNFDVLYFGLKFYPGKSGTRDKEINFGASIPVAQQYWQWHYGSITAQFNYYLPAGGSHGQAPAGPPPVIGE